MFAFFLIAIIVVGWFSLRKTPREPLRDSFETKQDALDYIRNAERVFIGMVIYVKNDPHLIKNGVYIVTGIGEDASIRRCPKKVLREGS